MKRSYSTAQTPLDTAKNKSHWTVAQTLTTPEIQDSASYLPDLSFANEHEQCAFLLERADPRKFKALDRRLLNVDELFGLKQKTQVQT